MSESAQFVHDLIGSMRCGFILPGILKHNIPEKLLESPKTVEELAEGTSINPDRLHRFMRHLENSICLVLMNLQRNGQTLKSPHIS